MCNCNANLRVSLQGSFLVASTQCCSCIKDHKSNLGMTRHKAAAAASMSSSLSSAAYIYMTSTDLQLWPLFFFVMSSARPTLYIYTKAFSILSLLHMYDTLALFYWSRFPVLKVDTKKEGSLINRRSLLRPLMRPSSWPGYF